MSGHRCATQSTTTFLTALRLCITFRNLWRAKSRYGATLVSSKISAEPSEIAETASFESFQWLLKLSSTTLQHQITWNPTVLASVGSLQYWKRTFPSFSFWLSLSYFQLCDCVQLRLKYSFPSKCVRVRQHSKNSANTNLYCGSSMYMLCCWLSWRWPNQILFCLFVLFYSIESDPFYIIFLGRAVLFFR